MQKFKYVVLSDYAARMEGATDGQTFYLASDVDARIAELERENSELKRQVQEWKDWLAGACI